MVVWRAHHFESHPVTDEETLVAHRSITANSWRYDQKGDQNAVKVYPSNDPVYVGS